jgi:protein ImuA
MPHFRDQPATEFARIIMKMRDFGAVFSPPVPLAAHRIVGGLRQVIGRIEATSGRAAEAGVIRFGLSAIDGTLGGGLLKGALHEIAAAREAEIAAATGFTLALAVCGTPRRAVLWIADDMARKESGAPYGPALDDYGLSPELFLTTAAAKIRDVLWAMEEALACRAVGAVIGEIRHDRAVDLTITRRLSLAASRRDALAFMLRTQPGTEPSAAATRWIIGAAPSRPVSGSKFFGPGPSRFAVRLVRNRRGHLGSWLVEWNHVEQCFDLAPAHPEPMAQAALDRPRQAAGA